MRISFSPQRRDGILTVSRQGDVLTVNGIVLDLSEVTEGETLSQDDINNEWIVGDIRRVDGVLHITLLLPHGADPSQEVAFPEPVTVTEDGPIPVPCDPDPEEITDEV